MLRFASPPGGFRLTFRGLVMSFNLTEKFLDFALLGAEWVMWLLVALSVISVYVMIERLLYFGNVAKADQLVRRKLLDALTDEDYEAASKAGRGSVGVAAGVIAEMAEVAQRGKPAVEAAMNSARGEGRLRLQKNLSFLGTLGANAPFIGLFGTVLGIIQAFNELSVGGVNPGGEQSATVMAAIAEALVATAVGLIVAIPAVVAYNMFQRRVKSLLASAESTATAAFALIVGDTGSDSSEDE